MFGADVFGAMRDGALFVNAGRGGTVDQDALLAEVARDRLRAVLDVTEPEPLPDDDPLWTAPGVLAITSHQAGDSDAADARAVDLAVDQLRAYAAGQPLRNVVRRGSP
jgi:phosphoglycerate dehydrogenase-like enzyme